MNMNFYVPVNMITGKGCLRANSGIFSKLGRKCMIVTGKNSAKKSGALDDLTAVLYGEGIEYVIFDGIEQNPTYRSCLAAAEEAKRECVSFIIGVGGGSPLDAAKAIAVLATCTDRSVEAIYSMQWDAEPLPILAVGTTAGTGSEVTPVAVITSPEGLKKSLRAPSLYPVAAFGDATYTMSLSPAFTRSTALDALSHCLESYFNRTANDVSRTFALRGMEILVEMLEKTAKCDTIPLSFEDRERLYGASIYGGYAISVTGTAFPHALGYFLSEQYQVSHGDACAAFLGEFIRHNVTVAPKESERLFRVLGIDSDALIALIEKNLARPNLKLTEEKLAELLPRYESNKSLEKSFGTVDRAFSEALLRRLF